MTAAELLRSRAACKTRHLRALSKTQLLLSLHSRLIVINEVWNEKCGGKTE